MPFYIPPLKDITQRVRNAFRAELPGTDAWLWPNNIYVTAKVLGGQMSMLFNRIAQIDKQRFAMTATGTGLLQHGAEWGIAQKTATYAYGIVTVPAVYPYTVPLGTVFARSDGVQFASTAAVSAVRYVTSALNIPVACTTIGKTGNSVYGTPLTNSLAGSPVSLVGSLGLGQGTDSETEADYRARILARKRQPPQGGAEYDYVAWGLSVPGVTRVFAKGKAYGSGTVGVWFLMDNTYLNGIPLPADVLAVQTYLNAVAPVTATVIVQAPVSTCIDVSVSGIYPDTLAIRASATLELRSVFRRMAQPGIPGAPFILRKSWLDQAVSNASGQNFHEIVTPSADVSFGSGQMPCLRNVTFIP